MNRCLCCYKELNKADNDFSWHDSCIKRFFSTQKIPEIKIDEELIGKFIDSQVTKGNTIQGVQKKFSLGLSKKEHNKLTLIDYPLGYILKTQVKSYTQLPEAEFLTMQMAKVAKINTVSNGLIKVNNEYAYITKRVDRIIKEEKSISLAMEDFCQLQNRLTEDKYKGSYENCAKTIQKFSSRPTIDLIEFFLRIVFSFIVGNSDMHLKNFSLLEINGSVNEYALAPAYDLLPVNIILKEDEEEFALTLNGKKKNITYNDFLKFSNHIGINEAVAIKIVKRTINLEEEFKKMIIDSLLSKEMKCDYINLIHLRCEKLKKIEY